MSERRFEQVVTVLMVVGLIAIVIGFLTALLQLGPD